MRRLVAVGLVLCAVFGVGPAARAAYTDAFVAVCNTTQSWTFSPSLTTTIRSGNTTQAYSNAVCANGFAGASTNSVWPLPVSESANAYRSPWTYNTGGGYFGDCSLAIVYIGFWGNSGVLIGGSVLLGDPTTFGANNAFGEAYVLVPLLAPCLQTGAIGAGPAFGVGASAGL